MQKKRMSYFMEGWVKLEKTCEGRLAFRSEKNVIWMWIIHSQQKKLSKPVQEPLWHKGHIDLSWI